MYLLFPYNLGFALKWQWGSRLPLSTSSALWVATPSLLSPPRLTSCPTSDSAARTMGRLGATNLKRTWNALTHNGIGAAASTVSKGLTYFAKNANYIRKPLLVALAKSSAAVIGSTFFQKLSVMERRLGLASR